MTLTADETTIDSPDGEDLAPWRPTAFLSRVLGITRGEAATVIVAVAVAVVLTVAGVAPVLRHRSSGDEVAAPTPASGARDVAPSVDGPAAPVVPAPLNTGASPTFAPETSAGDSSTSSGTTDPTPSGPTSPPTGELGTFAAV